MADREKPASEPDKEATGFSKWVAPAVILGILASAGGAFQVGIKYGQDSDSSLQSYYKERVAALERQIADLKGHVADCPKSATTKIPDNWRVDTQIMIGETLTLIKDQLFMTVVSTQPNPAPPRFKLSATVGAKDKDSISWEARPGDVKIFNGFELRVTGIDAASAYIRVDKAATATKHLDVNENE